MGARNADTRPILAGGAAPSLELSAFRTYPRHVFLADSRPGRLLDRVCRKRLGLGAFKQSKRPAHTYDARLGHECIIFIAPENDDFIRHFPYTEAHIHR